jgi:hypothetical protein
VRLRDKVSGQLLPQLRSFEPDLLFISAGFDAHFDDLYHFLTEQDYHWLTEQLCATVEPQKGRVISILEGGYSLSSPIPTPTRTQAKATQQQQRSHSPTPTHGGGRAGKGKNKKYDDGAAAVAAPAGAGGGLRSRSNSSLDVMDTRSGAGAGEVVAPSAPPSPQLASLDDGIASLPSFSEKEVRSFRQPGGLFLPVYLRVSNLSGVVCVCVCVQVLTLHEARSDAMCTVLQYSDDPHTKFAQLPGDGGLIKGVLAHVAALAGVPCWVKKK